MKVQERLVLSHSQVIFIYIIIYKGRAIMMSRVNDRQTGLADFFILCVCVCVCK